MFRYFSVEERIPADHPLRRVKAQADAVLGSMSAQFDAMYASGGRPSIASERLLKATLLIALYSVRSDRLFCEMLDYNMLVHDWGRVQPAQNGANATEHRIGTPKMNESTAN